MKLLILNYEYPPLGGGAGVVTKTIAEGLALSGHSVTVISAWFIGEEEFSEQQNLKIVRLKSLRRYTYRSNPREMQSWIVMSKKFLKTYCAQQDFDFCLANFSIPGGETALYIKKKFSIPYIVVSHGHDIPWFFAKQMFWYHLFTYFRIKKICIQSEHLILLSEAMKINADKFMGKRHCHKNMIISNGFDNNLFYPQYSHRNKTFTLVFSGRLVKQKDPMCFLKTLELLAAKKIDFKAVIFGDGVLRKKMEIYISENNLTERVSFKGWQKKETLAADYRNAHVFVSTSLKEGMSVAILEAVASGLYVFVTDTGSNASMIKSFDVGEMIRCNDYLSLANQIIDFYQYKFLKNFITPDKTLEEFRNKYRNKAMIDSYNALFVNDSK